MLEKQKKDIEARIDKLFKNENGIEARIDKLFKSVTAKDSEQARSFVRDLYESYTEAERSVPRQFTSFIVAWILFYAVAKGVVSEANVASFKIAQMNLLVAFGPPVLGFFSYKLASSMLLTASLTSAFWQCYSHVFPQAKEYGLDILLGPPTVIRAERINKNQTKKHSIHRFATDVFGDLMIIFGMVGTLIAITHVSYLMWGISELSLYVKIVSIFISIIMWVRSLLFWMRIMTI